MLSLEQLNKLRGVSTTNSTSAKPVSPIEEGANVRHDLGIDESILDKLDPKWRKLLEANKDADISKCINENTQYDDFGMPIFDFNNENDNGLPNISQFGLSE